MRALFAFIGVKLDFSFERLVMNFIPFNELPFPARLAIEYQDCQDYGKRTIAQLDSFIDHYFSIYNQVCDVATRRYCQLYQIKKHALVGDDLNGFVSEHPPENLEMWQREFDSKIVGVAPQCGHTVMASVEIEGRDHFAKLDLKNHDIQMVSDNTDARHFFETYFKRFHMLSYLYMLHCQNWAHYQKAA